MSNLSSFYSKLDLNGYLRSTETISNPIKSHKKSESNLNQRKLEDFDVQSLNESESQLASIKLENMNMP